jgi:hypothetical protein
LRILLGTFRTFRRLILPPNGFFASPVVVDAPAFEVAEVTWRQLERIGRGSGGEYEANAQRILRVVSMNRGKCQEGAQHRGDVAESSAHNEFLLPRALPG